MAFQISIIEKNRDVNALTLESHLPEKNSNIPTLFKDKSKADLSEREILYKVLFDMKNDLNELKKITHNLITESSNNSLEKSSLAIFNDIKEDKKDEIYKEEQTIEIEETLSLMQQEKKLIIKALSKHKDRRKDAAKELGISERTLYRKLKEFEL